MSALIFDRTQADADRAAYLIGKIQRREMLTEAEQAEYNAGLRGCYNITDLNRVEAKVRELAETLRSYGYSVDYTVPMKGASVLPSGYTELEYIQSSGTQYINTGFKPSGKSRIIMDCAPTSLSSTFCFYCSRTAASATASDTNTLFFYSNTYRGDYYGASSSTSGCYSANARFVIDNNQGMIYIGDNYIISNTTTSTSSPMPWILMASAKNSGSAVDTSSLGNYASMKLYSCKIYNNGTLVRDFVPAKNSSGTIGLYDTVNGAFYTNAGSGIFVAGPEISVLDDREWQYTDTMLELDVLLYLENIAALRDVIKLPPDVPPIPTIDRWIDWMAANDIERIVYELDRMIYGIVPLFRRCGTFRAGKNAQHLLLAKGVN